MNIKYFEREISLRDKEIQALEAKLASAEEGKVFWLKEAKIHQQNAVQQGRIAQNKTRANRILGVVTLAHIVALIGWIWGVLSVVG